MKLERSLVIALILSMISLAMWENHTREKGYIAAIDDNKALWAVQRAKLEKLTDNDFVVIGSSRSHFDIQLDEWEQETGRRPLMLSNDGTTPAPVLKDIVENTQFSGTLLIGVSPGLFFSEPSDSAWMWKRAQARIDHYYDRTWAQRINHKLSLPLERTFAFLNASEEDWADDIDLKSMISRIPMKRRLDDDYPPFYNFMHVDGDRNTYMFEKTVTDTAFANTIKRVWMSGPEDGPPAPKEPVFRFYDDLLTRFRERGGHVVFVRFPSSGDYRESENKHLPRNEYWEVLLKETNSIGYHFEDYPELSKYTIPEWSHLATPDAKKFTIDLVRIMQEDNVIPTLN
jgi:hypothetical protein